MKTCQFCGVDLAGTARRIQCGSEECERVYHATRARRFAADFKVRTGKAYWGRNLGRMEVFTKPCAWCGRVWSTTRRGSRACTLVCRSGLAKPGAFSPVPDMHPSRSTEIPPEHPCRRVVVRPRFCGHECRECGVQFLTDRLQLSNFTARYCSRRCTHRFERRLRKAKGYGATGMFTWAEFMRVYRLFGGCCAYCDTLTPLDRVQPDHVIPISRGGHNFIGNILPACPACNRSKNASTPLEWAQLRRVRGQEPRRTVWDPLDPRFRHLTAQSWLRCAS